MCERGLKRRVFEPQITRIGSCNLWRYSVVSQASGKPGFGQAEVPPPVFVGGSLAVLWVSSSGVLSGAVPPPPVFVGGSEV